MKCMICGKKISEKESFRYTDERGKEVTIYGLCNNDKCIDEYIDIYYDSEPNIDYEEIAQNQADDLWEDSALWKE